MLVGMNRLFRLGLSLEELQQRGVKLQRGQDVPYLSAAWNGAGRRGIGEQLTVLPKAPNCFVLLAKPKVHVSTEFVYGEFVEAGELSYHPDIDGQIQAIRDGDAYKMAELMGNVLETVTVPAFPVIREIKDTMLHYGAVNAMISGSGPTVFRTATMTGRRRRQPIAVCVAAALQKKYF